MKEVLERVKRSITTTLVSIMAALSGSSSMKEEHERAGGKAAAKIASIAHSARPGLLPELVKL